MKSITRYLQKNKKWVLLIVAYSIVSAFLNIGVIVSEDLAHHENIDWVFIFINEFTGTFSLIPFIPFLIWAFQKWPLKRSQLFPRLIGYFLLSLVFGFCYTSLMYGVRVPFYKLFGINNLDDIFNDLPYRYLMEYFKQFFSFWVVYFVYWAVQQYQKNREKERQEIQLKEELLKAQVQSLQMQLHPHFFFNTLNTISSVMYKDPARADKLISRLKDQPLHPLKKEVELLKQFTDVMQERYRDKLKVEFIIDEDCQHIQVPVLLLQPIVENAIKYAIDFKPITFVKLFANSKNNQLKLSIIDNGPGIPEGAFTQGTGLSSTISRLQKLFPEQHQFEMQNNEEGGLTVSISLPKTQIT